MAEIVITYDTVSKVMKATQDGKKIGDISSVIFASKYEKPGEYECEMMTNKHDEDNDTYHSYRMRCEKYNKEDLQAKLKEYFNKKNLKK